MSGRAGSFWGKSLTSYLRPFGCGLFFLLAVSVPVRAECDRLPRCELVWADEFEGTKIDRSKWQFQRGDGAEVGLPGGWGNNELQWYQEDNAEVEDGVLTITARRESVSGSQYTSARLRTIGLGDWRYGRFEMRAKMPVGQGLWAAFWMLPSDNAYGTWAASGEIDIVEYVGQEPNRILATLHYGGEWPDNAFFGEDHELRRGTFAEGFHVFAVEWEPAEIRWYVDDVHYATQTEWGSSGGPYPAPFDQRFHLLLNLAVGGNLPGPPDATTEFPQALVVDYVRVYQAAAAKGTQVSAGSLVFESPQRMRKSDSTLSIPFVNRSRKRDRPADPRAVTCVLRARGASRALRVKGKLELQLVGEVGGEIWTSAKIGAVLDKSGQASFSATRIQELVEQAAGAGANVERFDLRFDGAGSKKVKRLDLDCWQRRAAQ